MFDNINPYVAKIIIAARDGDSIRRISMKIRESYGWTYKWVRELEKIGVVKRKGQEVFINTCHAFYSTMLAIIRSSLSLSDAYEVMALASMDYMFIHTDAVFVWTRGGYNVGRSKASYPIFVQVREDEKKGWEDFFSRLDLPYTYKTERKRGIYMVISTAAKIEKELCDTIPVLPLTKTLEWMRKYPYNFQPAFEMIDEMHGTESGVHYT